MEVGFLGTGRMGKVMAANLLKAGHRVRAWDKSSEPLHAIVAANYGADFICRTDRRSAFGETRPKATEVPMKGLRLAAISTVAITSVLLILASGYTGLAQTPAPTLAPPLISLAEARVIIDGAIAFTREQNLNMAVV